MASTGRQQQQELGGCIVMQLLPGSGLMVEVRRGGPDLMVVGRRTVTVAVQCRTRSPCGSDNLAARNAVTYDYDFTRPSLQ